MSQSALGVIAGILAFVLWGVLPVFWKLLSHVPADQVLLHRVWWSAVFMFLLLHWRRYRYQVPLPSWSRKRALWFLLTAVLVASNWFIYIWAVAAGYVLECSLGYFITPLLSVLFGFLILREQLSVAKWLSVLLALASVLYLTFDYGQVPYIALGLAFTFALYALLRKLAPVGSLDGLYMESILLAPFALAAMAYYQYTQQSAVSYDLASLSLLALSGPVTAVPLLFFAYAARTLQLSTIGLMQYLSPCLQFALAVFVYDETFTKSHAWAFVGIWLALFIFTYDNSVTYRKQRAVLSPQET